MGFPPHPGFRRLSFYVLDSRYGKGDIFQYMISLPVFMEHQKFNKKKKKTAADSNVNIHSHSDN